MPLHPLLVRLRRSAFRGALVGWLLASIPFSVLLTAGRWELAPPRPTTDFYDMQAESLLDGRWDVPAARLGIEAFVVGGRAYMYFGPFPALLRMPVEAVSGALRGRLSQPSMILAWLVCGVSVASIISRVAEMTKATPGLRASLVSGLFAFTVGAGSPLVFIASQLGVYHEAILWGVAWTLATYALVLKAWGKRTPGSVSAVCAACTFAILSRASVGTGAVATVALAAVVHGWRDRRRIRSLDRGSCVLLAAFAVSVFIPLAAYAAVNQARFGHPWRLPLESQVYSRVDPSRQAALAENGGSLFGLRYVPTTLLQYLRPDAVDLDPLFPWIVFPHEPPAVVGNAVFDTLDEASSLTATSPVLAVSAIVGLWAVAKARIPRIWTALVLGGSVGCAGVATIGFVANRYLGDFVPFLVASSIPGWMIVFGRGDGQTGVLGLVGKHRVARTRSRAPRLDPSTRSCSLALSDVGTPRARAGVRRAAALAGVVVAVGVGVAWSVWSNVALALEYQRLIAPAEISMRRDFVGFQYALDGTERVRTAESAAEIGLPRRRGDVVVVGDCEALLWSDGFTWSILEAGPRWRRPPVLRERAGIFPPPSELPEDVPSPDLCLQLLTRLSLSGDRRTDE